MSTKLRLLATAMALFGGLGAVAQTDTHSFTVTPDYATSILLNDTLGAHLSQEAKRIIGRPFSPNQMSSTSNDRSLMAYLKSPLVMDLSQVKRFHLDCPDARAYITEMYPTWQEKQLLEARDKSDKIVSTRPLGQMISSWDIARESRNKLMLNYPSLAYKTIDDLPAPIVAHAVTGAGYQGELENYETPMIPTQNTGIVGETIERKYWRNRVETHLHFSQNQVSANWHKGGYNSINLNGRVYANATYEKDRIKWVNELDYRIGLFTNDISGKKLDLKISEDAFRANSNMGVKAFRNFYYTFDSQLRSQMMTNVNKDSILTTRIFAPIILDAGIGMKYDIDLKQFRGDPFQRIRFSANLAPVSASLIYTYADDIDKGRIGLQDDEKYRFRLGSSVRLDLNWEFSNALSWTSRLFYNTSYQHVEIEFDNSIAYAFSRFLSTRLTLNTRFDDSVILDEPKTFKNLIQYNQLFSLGFEYKF